MENKISKLNIKNQKLMVREMVPKINPVSVEYWPTPFLKRTS